MNRRDFIYASIAVAACGPRPAGTGKPPAIAFSPPRPDPGRILDLPADFRYRVISRAGEEMTDGLLLPGRPDGMAAFQQKDGRIALIRNHELFPLQRRLGPFGRNNERLDRVDPEKIYDRGTGDTPGTGGTSTAIYNPESGRVERQFLSLAGTELNCAGGATPWGSWLSCEECFEEPGTTSSMLHGVKRERRHGYVFEIRADAARLQRPRPLPALGRFKHEAVAVDPATGVLYLTEDTHDSLLYRFLPATKGDLADGGQLQALVLTDKAQWDTSNLKSDQQTEKNVWMDAQWIDIDGADTANDDLRFRGFEQGAARFDRGEGITYNNGELCICCTTGGPKKMGQIFRYRPSPFEGQPAERREPGKLMLFVEAETGSALANGDNLVSAPNGDLFVCEDASAPSRIIIVRPDGSLSTFAAHPYSGSELAGACFSPDGSVMFVNIQDLGLTLSISGDWSSLRSIDNA